MECTKVKKHFRKANISPNCVVNEESMLNTPNLSLACAHFPLCTQDLHVSP